MIARHPNLTVRNISQGAYIRGTKPTETLNKATAVFNSAILKKELEVVEKSPSVKINFHKNNINLIKIIDKFYNEIERANYFNSTVNCISEFLITLESKMQEKSTKILLSGSLKYILFSIYSHENHIRNCMKEDYIKKTKWIIKNTINDFKVEIISLNKDRK